MPGSQPDPKGKRPLYPLPTCPSARVAITSKPVESHPIAPDVACSRGGSLKSMIPTALKGFESVDRTWKEYVGDG